MRDKNKRGKNTDDLNTEVNETEEIFEKKPKRYAAYIYLAMALLIVVVTVVSIISLSYTYETPEYSLPAVSLPGVSQPAPNENSVPDKPTGNEQSNVPAGTDESQMPQTVFVSPIEGKKVLKPYTMETLVFSATMQDYRTHSGVDLAAAEGSDVLCYTDGKISKVYTDDFYGKTVAVEHDYGLVSYYMNLSETLPENVTVGAEVKAGDVLGKVGKTARVELKDDAHLHFELRVDGDLIDPMTELAETE